MKVLVDLTKGFCKLGRRIARRFLRLIRGNPWNQGYRREQQLFVYTHWDRYWLDTNRQQRKPSPKDVDVIEYDLLRFTHAIDKGLQLPNRRAGFGRFKVECVLNMVKLLENSSQGREQVIRWAYTVLNDYAKVLADDLDNRGLTSEERTDLSAWLEKLNQEIATLPSLSDSGEAPSPVEGISPVYFERRSVRQWADKPVEDVTLEKLVKVALWAPSSCNRQPYKFLFVRSEESKRLVLEVAQGGKSFAEKAPVLLVLLADVRAYCAPSERHLAYIDAALASQNLALAACELGLGAVWLNCSVEDFSAEDQLRLALKIPPWYAIVGAMAIGYQRDEEPRNPSARRSVQSVVVYERFV